MAVIHRQEVRHGCHYPLGDLGPSSVLASRWQASSTDFGARPRALHQMYKAALWSDHGQMCDESKVLLLCRQRTIVLCRARKAAECMESMWAVGHLCLCPSQALPVLCEAGYHSHCRPNSNSCVHKASVLRNLSVILPLFP